MASKKPGSVEHADKDNSDCVSSEDTLLSMENIDRASPEIWPEKIPGVSHYREKASSSTPNEPLYTKTLTEEDQKYILHLASLTPAGLIAKVKELHDIAYQLGVEEAKEVTRGKYLNLFNKKRKSE